jgi:hypothetical protein
MQETKKKKNPERSKRDYWRTQWHPDRFFSEYFFRFPSSPRTLNNHSFLYLQRHAAYISANDSVIT